MSTDDLNPVDMDISSGDSLDVLPVGEDPPSEKEQDLHRLVYLLKSQPNLVRSIRCQIDHSEGYVRCTLCNTNLTSRTELSTHLESHCNSQSVCLKCGQFCASKGELAHHLKSDHQDDNIERIMSKTIEYAQLWTKMYAPLFGSSRKSGAKRRHGFLGQQEDNNNLSGSARDWCLVCAQLNAHLKSGTVFQGIQGISYYNALHHLCTQLGYLRFVCTLCMDKCPQLMDRRGHKDPRRAFSRAEHITQSAISFPSPEHVHSHIETHHKFAYQIEPPHRVILKRFMVVGAIERLLTDIHQRSEWWIEPEESQLSLEFRKRDLQRLFREDQDRKNHLRAKQQLFEYCQMQEKLFSRDVTIVHRIEDEENRVPKDSHSPGDIRLVEKKSTSSDKFTFIKDSNKKARIALKVLLPRSPRLVKSEDADLRIRVRRTSGQEWAIHKDQDGYPVKSEI